VHLRQVAVEDHDVVGVDGHAFGRRVAVVADVDREAVMAQPGRQRVGEQLLATTAYVDPSRCGYVVFSPSSISVSCCGS
jgi:hypothetical protein